MFTLQSPYDSQQTCGGTRVMHGRCWCSVVIFIVRSVLIRRLQAIQCSQLRLLTSKCWLLGALCHCQCFHYPQVKLQIQRTHLWPGAQTIQLLPTCDGTAIIMSNIARFWRNTYTPRISSGLRVKTHGSKQRGGGRIRIGKANERDALQPLSQRTNSLRIQMKTTGNKGSACRIKGLTVWLVAHDQCQVFSIMFCHLQN